MKLGMASLLVTTGLAYAQPAPGGYLFNDSHFHLTNYVQQGVDIREFLNIMGTKVGRTALFSIPLQQQWSHQDSGNTAPTYYLDTDAPLYYYSFTDAHIAQAYLSLPPDQRQRFDPMITGFNPADMYAADHIRRVLLTFPGVFSGIGEFTIHKEFVSSMDVPFPRPGASPMYLQQMKTLLRSHPETTIIWAHTGVGRAVRPVEDHGGMLEQFLGYPAYKHVHFDISWDLVANYVVASDQTIRASAGLLNRYPDRFLFGTDDVAPRTPEKYIKVFEIHQPLWRALTPEASEKVRKGNYERIFDTARTRVRKWESAQAAR